METDSKTKKKTTAKKRTTIKAVKTYQDKVKKEKKEKIIVKEKTIIYGTFTEDRVVEVKAIESSGKWQTLLVKGQEMKKDPFLYNKVKRSYQVPLNSERKGGGVKIILDNINRVNVKKYIAKYPHGITEQEFFELELGIDLNPALPKDENFWRTDKRGRVTLTKKGLTLNLNRSMDLLRYKILLSNRLLVAPSYDDRRLKATYEFMIVNEGRVTTKKVEEANLKATAYGKFAEVTSSKDNMVGFIKSLGRTIPINHTEDWLKGEVLTVLENNTNHFLSVVNDSSYKARIFIQEAVEAGALKRMNNKRYILDGGAELGDVNSVINYFEDPEHQEAKARVKAQVEMFKKK